MLSALRKVFPLTDYTSLSSTDTPDSIIHFCDTAVQISEEHGIAGPASVCVFPVFVRTAVSALGKSGIKVSSVAGYFPSGLAPLDLKINEIDYALQQGADEIDFVINRSFVVEGNYNKLAQEVSKSKEHCKNNKLKVILESGELSEGQIQAASKVILENGGDFLKTSTGKISTGATLPASRIMMMEIRDYYRKTGKKSGFKAAGGIREYQQAFEFIELAERILGEEYVHPELFRIGASSLISNMLAEL